MKKEELLKKIEDLAKYMKSSKAKKALNILREELSLGPKPKTAKAPTIDELPLPLDVKDDHSKIALFTDGACRGNPGPGAWAYLIQLSDGKIFFKNAEVNAQTTNNKMELLAIVKGLQYLNSSTKGKKIYIYTDSKYAVDGMKSWIAGWKRRGWKKADNKAPENLELWQTLDELNMNLDLSFNWIKGHAGHPQNEYVDKMANDVLDESGY